MKNLPLIKKEREGSIYALNRVLEYFDMYSDKNTIRACIEGLLDSETKFYDFLKEQENHE